MGTPRDMDTLIEAEELKQRIRALLHRYQLDELMRQRHLAHLRARARQLRNLEAVQSRGRPGR